MAAIVSAWNRSTEIADGYRKYQYDKIAQKPSAWLKFSVTVYIFSGKNNRTEIHAKTYDQNEYFKIIEVAQKHLPKMDSYYFDSSYDRFPKDDKGLCSVYRKKLKNRQPKLQQA